MPGRTRGVYAGYVSESHLTVGGGDRVRPAGTSAPDPAVRAEPRRRGAEFPAPGRPGRASRWSPAHAAGSARGAVARARHTVRAASVPALFRHSLRELPFDYPPKVVVSADLALLAVGVVACLQRHTYFPTVLPLIALLLLFVSLPGFFLFGIVPRPLPLIAATMVAAALFFVQPVEADFAPFVLMVVVAEIAAISAKRLSGPLAVLATTELAVFAVLGDSLWGDSSLRTGVPMYALGILLGWLVGVMLQYQRLFLYQERENQSVRAAQAAAAERGRIAREVHDVIAHSLTVTLLHVTAARRALTTDRDVDEAVDALVDAERLGRQAMADIRRTVGLLNSGPAASGAEPGADDIPALVDDFVDAGLTVHRRITGDPGAVSAAVGLALYRICQESLANIVKHAPGATVDFAVEVGAESVAVRVHNSIPGGPPTRAGHGTGVAGMRQRADGLGGRIRIGPEAGGWTVLAEFSLDHRPAGDGSAAGGAGSRCPLSHRAGTDPRPPPAPDPAGVPRPAS